MEHKRDGCACGHPSDEHAISAKVKFNFQSGSVVPDHDATEWRCHACDDAVTRAEFDEAFREFERSEARCRDFFIRRLGISETERDYDAAARRKFSSMPEQDRSRFLEDWHAFMSSSSRDRT